MNQKLVNLWTKVSFVFVFSFLLNFVWESLHAVYLYEGHNFAAKFYVRMILYVSTIDALLVCLILVIGSFVFDKFSNPLNLNQISFTFILGVLIAAIIEAKALFFKQWIYTDLMPTIFGMGLSPLLQLAVTGVISFFLVSKFFNRK